MSDSVRPHRWQPIRIPRSWASPGKNTVAGCHFFFQCMTVKSESEVAQSCPTLSDPMDCSLPAPPSMAFSRQEYWSGLPLPSLLLLTISHQNITTNVTRQKCYLLSTCYKPSLQKSDLNTFDCWIVFCGMHGSCFVSPWVVHCRTVSFMHRF